MRKAAHHHPAEAEALQEIVARTGRFLGVTYTYSGYPMVVEARARIAAGLLGKVRTVQVEYPLEWMATGVELKNNPQAAWRVDPLKTAAADRLAISVPTPIIWRAMSQG